MGLSTAPLDRARRQALLLGLGAGVLLALALTALLGGLLRRRVVVPLEGLRAALRRVKSQDYGTTLEVTGARELREVAEGFNAMTQMVGEAHARLESLAATDPLTGLANHRHFYERLGEEL